MRRGAGVGLVLALLAPSARAIEPISLGIRGGVGLRSNSASFHLLDVFSRGPTPWAWGRADGWRLRLRWTASLGILEDDGTRSTMVTAGLEAALSRRASALSLVLGTAPTLLSQEEFPTRDLGGAYHFTSHLGLEYAFGRGPVLGYRLQHTSNAGLFTDNPGLDMHALYLEFPLHRPRWKPDRSSRP